MKYALLSVSDKSGITEFAAELISLGYEILSTGGTLKALQEKGIKATEVSQYTGFNECFSGRVKTLHPKIHGGLLYRRENSEDVKTANELGIGDISLLCVNLYPFVETTKKTENLEEIIENIDIGGPAMIRAAAKNYKSVLVITNPKDYEKTISALKNEKVDENYRFELAIAAFSHTADYDCKIANYFNSRFHNGFGARHFVSGRLVFPLRYGENPHQNGCFYEYGDFYQNHFRLIKGEPSYNNLTDIHAAVKIASSFGDAPCVCIVKHGNPCGFALKNTALESYTEALKCDPLSAYGGVVAVNAPVDEELALKINEIFVEVLIAPKVEFEALAVFANKKKIKIFEANASSAEAQNGSDSFQKTYNKIHEKAANSENKDILHFPEDIQDFRHIAGGFLVQECDKVQEEEFTNMRCVGDFSASEEQINDLKIAYKLAAFVKSNCVVYVKNSAMVAVGMGMTSRVDSAIAAIRKAKSQNIDLEGCVLASEAFFPFKDSIEEAAKVGVSAIIEPGGSLRDEEVIKCANEQGIALYFTGVRHFLH